ncbi:MAG: sugar porter family MFS transporter [Actinomycetes bacterium]
MSVVSSTVDREAAKRLAKMVAIGGALLGILYGYDQANAGSAQLFFKPDLGLSDWEAATTLTAVPYGILLGCLLGSIPSNRWGRKKTVLMVTIGYIIFCLAEAAAWNFASIMVARMLLGVTIGVSLICVPVFIAESAATAKRGRVLVAYQLAGVFGIMCAFAVAMAVNNLPTSWNWRLMFAVSAIPALCLLPLVLKLPETSRWLMMKGRRAEAEAVLLSVDPDVDPTATLDEMQAAIADEAAGSLGHMFRKPYLRATIFLVIMGLLIQLTGINAFVSYGPIIIKELGFDNFQSLGLNLVINTICFIAVIVAMLYVDRWGRKPIIMGGFAGMVVGVALAGLAFGTVGAGGFAGWQKVVALLGQTIVMASFNFGVGGTVWAWASESLPSHLRTYGAAVLLAADLIGNIVILQFFTAVVNAIGMTAVMGIFAVLAIIGILFVWKFAPETKGRDVDDVRKFWENGGKWPEEGALAGATKAPGDGSAQA